MTAPGELPRRKLIALLRQFEYEGPFSGKKHQFMRRGLRTVRIPNPHMEDIGWQLVREILKQADVAEEEALRILGCD